MPPDREDARSIARQEIRSLREQVSILRAERDEAREDLLKVKHDLKRFQYALAELQKQTEGK